MYATIQKWGNSQGLRIPKALLEERLTAFYGKPIDQIDRIEAEELDWGKAEGSEAW